MVVRFVHIHRIVDHHCLNFLFIITLSLLANIRLLCLDPIDVLMPMELCKHFTSKRCSCKTDDLPTGDISIGMRCYSCFG